jgi:hypothetical protein
MIDLATSWFKIHQYGNKRAITVANIAEEDWFSRYPWPTQPAFDRGSEFRHEFKKMLNDYGEKEKPITNRNLQANAIVEFIKSLLTSLKHLNSMITIWMRMILGKEILGKES